ncbi:hypothetical protein [Paenibacillus jiagnxiensis]|uniref:hypothetical protein n=1 Tax=Paenibacillus jiagnxiensis TaxID=3228926 RepID=UPI0033B09DC5
MSFIAQYVLDWLNIHDESIEDERLRIQEQMARHMAKLIEGTLHADSGIQSTLIELEDAYTRRQDLHREIFFRRGMAFAYSLAIQGESVINGSPKESVHPHLFEYGHTELYRRDLHPTEKEAILREQMCINQLHKKIHQKAVDNRATRCIGFLHEMDGLYGLVQEEIKEIYFLRGMLHGYCLFSSLLAEIGSPYPTSLVKHCG